jgi:hypothetical protein
VAGVVLSGTIALVQARQITITSVAAAVTVSVARDLLDNATRVTGAPRA